MKVVKINKNTPKKFICKVITCNNSKARTIEHSKNLAKPAYDCSDALRTLERNALEMSPEDYINARTYLSSLALDRLYK